MRSLRKSVSRRLALQVVPGALVLGTSCVDSLRESVVSGSLGFVEGTATAILEGLFPADALLPES